MPRSLLLFSFVFCWCTVGGFAQTVDPAYVQVTQERADKMVASLGLTDPAQSRRVREIIARQYRDLKDLHEARDAATSAAQADAGSDPAVRDAAVKAVRDASAVQVAHLHYAFLGRLAAELTPAQVDQVKDGLTYGVRPLTYQVYQDLVPGLTDEQKRQILAWLTEAREHAMDGGSSQEKHGWFGKYKGRINNYLAAAGIDLKQAERDLTRRRQASK